MARIYPKLKDRKPRVSVVPEKKGRPWIAKHLKDKRVARAAEE